MECAIAAKNLAEASFFIGVINKVLIDYAAAAWRLSNCLHTLTALGCRGSIVGAETLGISVPAVPAGTFQWLGHTVDG